MYLKSNFIFAILFFGLAYSGLTNCSAQSQIKEEDIESEISYLWQLIIHNQTGISAKRANDLRLKLENLNDTKLLQYFKNYETLVAIELDSYALNNDPESTNALLYKVTNRIESLKSKNEIVSDFYDKCMNLINTTKTYIQSKNIKPITTTLPQIESVAEQINKEYSDLIASYKRIKSDKNYIIPDASVKNYNYFNIIYRNAFGYEKIEMYNQAIKLYYRGYKEMNDNDIRNDIYPIFIYKLYENHLLLNNTKKAYDYLILFTKEAYKPYTKLRNTPEHKGDHIDKAAKLLYKNGRYSEAIGSWALLNGEYITCSYKYTNYHRIHIANAFMKLDKIDDALYWYHIFLDDCKASIEASLASLTPHAYYLVGNAYLAKKDYINAKVNLEKSYELLSNKIYAKRIKNSNNGNLWLAKKFGFNERKKIYSRNEDFMNLNRDLGKLYIMTGNKEKAVFHMTQFAQLTKKTVFDDLLWEVEKNRVHKVNSSLNQINEMFYFLSQLKPRPIELTGVAYNHALFGKSLLLKSAKAIRENAINNEIPEISYYYNKWLDTRKKSKSYKYDNKDSLADFERFYEKHFINLSKTSFKTLNDNTKVDWRLIKNSLTQKEVAIEFISYYNSLDKTHEKELKYGALIINKNSDYPNFIELCSSNKLDKILSHIKANNNSPKSIQTFYTQYNKSLYELLWKPLEIHIKKANKVSYALTGQLNQLAFSAFVNPKSNKYLSEEYILNQVSTTKNLLNKNLNNVTTVFKDALIFGNINYDFQNSNSLALTRSEDRGSSFKKLVGTKIEIEKISNLLKNNNIKTHLFDDTVATEENFYSQINNRTNIIHIATHAFYLPSNEPFTTDLEGEFIFNEDLDPMNRSSLVLSGANYFWRHGSITNKDSANDGLLTANELSFLDLSEVKLVVLSACETGIGSMSESEGVYGIQRALNVAGAKSMLLSLWKVDDVVTQNYMTEFYTHLIKNKLPITEAYIKTQEVIRKKHPNPYYWSAFVLIN